MCPRPTLPLLGSLVAALTLAACSFGGDDGGGDATDAGAGGEGATGGAGGGEGGVSAAPTPIESEPAPTLGHAVAYDAMVALAARATFTVDNLGDPTRFVGEGVTEPSQPTQLASLYLESGDLSASVQAIEDNRPGVMANPDFGKGLAQDFVQDLSLGAVSDSADDERGGAHFLGWHAVRTLDGYLLLRSLEGLNERSGAGFDRALALLWDAEGAPQGLGKRIADADAACGTGVLDELKGRLADVRGPFVTALEEKGQFDPLDRKVISVGDSPEYDAFLTHADRLLHEGLALAFLAGLRATPLTPLDQAQAMGTYAALSARVAAQNPDGDAYIGQQLDQSVASQIDVAGSPGEPGVAGLTTAVFGVACAP